MDLECFQILVSYPCLLIQLFKKLGNFKNIFQLLIHVPSSISNLWDCEKRLHVPVSVEGVSTLAGFAF